MATTKTPAAPAPATAPPVGGVTRFALPTAVATVVLFALSGVVAPASLSSTSLLAMLPFAAVVAVAAIGQTLVVQQRGIDLSVPAGIVLAGTVAGQFSRQHGGVLVPVLLALAVTTLVGLLNGVLVTRFRVTPLIGTLAVNSLGLGVLWGYGEGGTFNAPAGLASSMTAQVLGLRLVFWFAVLIVVVAAVLTTLTVTGRRFTAVGANPAAARAVGLNVDRYVVAAYSTAGLLYGVAGLMLAGYTGTTAPSVGTSYLLPVIAAVIVGGTSLAGGRGSVVASAIAALFLSQLVQLVLTLGAPSSVQLLVQAGAIAAAAALRALPWSSVVSRVRRGG